MCHEHLHWAWQAMLSSAPTPRTVAADVYARGGTLAQHWHQLQQQYGAFEYRSGYYIAQPPSKSAAVFGRLRAVPPSVIGGLAVQAVRDLGTGQDTAQPGGWNSLRRWHVCWTCEQLLRCHDCKACTARVAPAQACTSPPLPQMARRCCPGRQET